MTSVSLKVRLIPNASRTVLVGWLGDTYKIKVQAPPENNKANEALIALLAKTLKISKKQITIEAGRTSQEKLLKLEGVDQDQIACLR